MSSPRFYTMGAQSTIATSFTADTCNKYACMFSDAVPTVLAAEWDAQTDMFDGDQAKGPVQRLFALNLDKAKANLSSDPERAFRDLQRIFSRVTENIPSHSSFEMVMSPRMDFQTV